MSAKVSPTILVTGASGMLGRALRETLNDSYPFVGVSKRGLEGSIACDLAEEASARRLFEQNKPDLVINTAAYSDVDGCERDPKLAFESNAVIPKVLSKLCSEKKIPWIHVSTEYVFSGKKGAPSYLESDEALPKSIYGMTKWAGEYHARASLAPAAVIRTSWLFGAPKTGNFVNDITERMKKESVVSVLDNQTDSPTSVKDLSQALRKTAEFLLALIQKNPDKRWNEVFHVCNSGSATHFDMAVQIRDLLGLSGVRIERMSAEAAETLKKRRVALRPTPYVAMSNEKFQRFFGMKLRPWQESLEEYLKK